MAAHLTVHVYNRRGELSPFHATTPDNTTPPEPHFRHPRYIRCWVSRPSGSSFQVAGRQVLPASSGSYGTPVCIAARYSPVPLMPRAAEDGLDARNTPHPLGRNPQPLGRAPLLAPRPTQDTPPTRLMRSTPLCLAVLMTHGCAAARSSYEPCASAKVSGQVLGAWQEINQMMSRLTGAQADEHGPRYPRRR